MTKDSDSGDFVVNQHGERVYAGETQSVYRANSLGPVLGYPRKDQTGDISYTATNTYEIKFDRYISLHIRDLERVDSNNASNDGSFTVIPLDTTVNNFLFAKNCDGIDNDTYIKYFNPPLQQLAKFDIELRTPAGNLYEFNGHDHTFTFEVTSLSRYDKYQ